MCRTHEHTVGKLSEFETEYKVPLSSCVVVKMTRSIVYHEFDVIH